MKRINLHFSDSEFEVLEAIAQESNLTPNEFIQRCISLGGALVKKHPNKILLVYDNSTERLRFLL